MSTMPPSLRKRLERKARRRLLFKRLVAVLTLQAGLVIIMMWGTAMDGVLTNHPIHHYLNSLRGLLIIEGGTAFVVSIFAGVIAVFWWATR